VLVGNPPFLGGKLLRRELGSSYVEALFSTFGNRVRPEADLCCYWFEKARKLIEEGKCKRAGLLATQGIRGGANRETLKRIKEAGGLFFAVSDRNWVLAGANVHVSMVGFDDGSETLRSLDGKSVEQINPNLTATTDVTTAKELKANLDVAFMGTTKGGAFDIPESRALELLSAPNPQGKPNSDIVVPWVNGMDLTQRPSGTWIIDYGVTLPQPDAAKYEAVFQHALTHIKPQRDSSRTTIKEWWLHERRRGEMRVALAPLPRFLCTTRVSKHRLFVWLQAPTLPDSATFAFARADDFFFGVLHSRIHEIWARMQGTQVRERESGFRYTPTTCFETFPFPFAGDLEQPTLKPPEPDPTYAENLAAKNYFMGKEEPPPYGSRREKAHPSPSAPRAPNAILDQYRAATADAAKELNELRERWLNPPEWTIERSLEFPGSADGPWSHYVVKPSQNGIGTVRYPRLEPRDAECAAQLKLRTLTNLYNARPTWLELAHKKLDTAVAAAYGWPADLTDEQILERLLALNLERAAEEAQAASLKKPKTSRSKHADELI
jgi:type II restriction/modification system DNA methylase subunit YeeA